MQKPYLFFTALLVCMSCSAQTFDDTMPVDNKTLYPYLGANDRYGYANPEGQLIIEPEYTHVSFFLNGLAAVRRDGGKDSLINTDNRVVPLPADYDELRLQSYGDHVLVEATRYYTNRWRFWEWRFLPGFSIIGGGSSDRRLFDTEVAREESTLYWGNGLKKMKSKKGGYGGGETVFFVQDRGEGVVQVDHELFRMDDGRLSRLAKHVEPYKTVDGGFLLQKRIGGSFRLIDHQGNAVSRERFKQISEFLVRVAGKEVVLKSNRGIDRPRTRVELYRNRENQVFVYPDLGKEFPTDIASYPLNDSISAETILTRAQSIASIPNTDRFIIVADFGKTVNIVDTKGKWHDPEENQHDFKVLSAGVNNILWPTPEFFMENAEIPDGWELKHIREVRRSPKELFLVRFENEDDSAEGVWDRENQHWLMEPAYHRINAWTYRTPFIAFQKEKDGLWGFYDLELRQEHISLRYNRMQGGGWVGIDSEPRSQLFYLDINSKREFRAQ